MAIFLWIAFPFLLFTIAKTKLEWYILPVYPALSICIGAFYEKIIKCHNRTFILQCVLIFSLIIGLASNELTIIEKIKFSTLDGGV